MRLRWDQGAFVLTFRRALACVVVSCLLWFSALPGHAVSGPEALRLAEFGSSEEFAAVLASHTPAELFRVRAGGRGLLHLALSRGEAFWGAALSAGWPVADEKGWTPQHEAALLGADKALAALLKAGAAVNAKEPVNGGTPLHVASFHGHLAVVKVLLAAGANVNARDGEGWTALSQARDQGFPQVVEYLKRHGATR